LFSKIKNKKVSRLLKLSDVPEISLNESINSKASLDKIKSHEPDLLISILGNQIFKKPLLRLAPKGCINLHTALLPKYRGLMPTFWVLRNCEPYTGVSVFFVDEGIDSGPIIIQKKIKIGNKTQAELIKHSKKLGMDAISEAIKLIMNEDLKLISNDETKKTYYSFPTKLDVIEFKKLGKKFF